jgi:hypothetical protein
MIDKTMIYLLGELNGYIGTVFPSGEPQAVLSSLALHDGTSPREIENKLVLTLTNVEREYAAQSREVASYTQGNSALHMGQPLNLNLYFLLSSNYSSDCAQALRLLSAALGFFHERSVFAPQDSPAFPRGLQRLTVEMVNLSIGELHNLWASNGSKYLPSAFYKARMVTLQDGWITERVPVVTGAATRTSTP